MKRILHWLLIIPLVGMMVVGCTKTDEAPKKKKPTEKSLVSTDPQPRNAVLEEFTGIKCGFCPDGHAIAKDIANTHPGRVVIINIHAGSYAVPSAGQPDFRTPYGDALVSFGGVTGFPQGMVNRTAPGGTGALAMGRNQWAAASGTVINSGNSPVNIGMSSTWTETSRTLKIKVELYFTSALSGIGKLNVVLLQNGVIGYQASGGDNYQHNHILREMMTGQWGEDITETAQATKVVKEYTYVLPAEYDVEDCDIAAFVTGADNKLTHTGIQIVAKNGTTAAN